MTGSLVNFDFVPTAAKLELTQIGFARVSLRFSKRLPFTGTVKGSVRYMARIFDAMVNGVPLDVGRPRLPAGAGRVRMRSLTGARCLWAPLNRCPVDNSAMLAADGRTIAASCLASFNGEMKLGGTTVPTGASNLQLGVLNQSGTYTLVAPQGGAIIAATSRSSRRFATRWSTAQ